MRMAAAFTCEDMRRGDEVSDAGGTGKREVVVATVPTYQRVSSSAQRAARIQTAQKVVRMAAL